MSCKRYDYFLSLRMLSWMAGGIGFRSGIKAVRQGLQMLQIGRIFRGRKLFGRFAGAPQSDRGDTMTVIVVEPGGSTLDDIIAEVEHFLIRIVALASILMTLIDILRAELIRFLGH